MIHLFRFVIICVFKDASEYTDYICEIPNSPKFIFLKGSMFFFRKDRFNNYGKKNLTGNTKSRNSIFKMYL